MVLPPHSAGAAPRSRRARTDARVYRTPASGRWSPGSIGLVRVLRDRPARAEGQRRLGVDEVRRHALETFQRIAARVAHALERTEPEQLDALGEVAVALGLFVQEIR